MTAHFVNLLDQVLRRSLRMASLVEDMLEEACEALFQADDALARRVVHRDEEVDAEEVAVEAEVFRLLALYQPVGADLRLLCTVLKVNNDLERIADCAVNIAERAKHLDAPAVAVGGGPIRQIWLATQDMLRTAIQVYGSADTGDARAVLTSDQTVDALYQQYIKSLVANAPNSPNGAATLLDLLSVAKNLERIADHATNIAEDVIFLRTGQIVRHRGELPID